MENDLISRDKLLDDLNDINETDYGSISDYRAHMAVSRALSDVRRIVDGYPSVEAEPRWISVKDGLPEKTGYYLCWVEASSVGERKESEHRKLYWEENVWLSSAKSFRTEHPLYWMPLPEPPKMDGGAEG